MTRIFLLSALIASLVVNGLLLLNRHHTSEDQPKYGAVEQRLTERAKSLWRQKEPQSAIEQQGRYAQVIHFADTTCVSFELMPGGVGGVPVYCFNPSGDNLMQRMDEVE